MSSDLHRAIDESAVTSDHGYSKSTEISQSHTGVDNVTDTYTMNIQQHQPQLQQHQLQQQPQLQQQHHVQHQLQPQQHQLQLQPQQHQLQSQQLHKQQLIIQQPLMQQQQRVQLLQQPNMLQQPVVEIKQEPQEHIMQQQQHLLQQQLQQQHPMQQVLAEGKKEPPESMLQQQLQQQQMLVQTQQCVVADVKKESHIQIIHKQQQQQSIRTGVPSSHLIQVHQQHSPQHSVVKQEPIQQYAEEQKKINLQEQELEHLQLELQKVNEQTRLQQVHRQQSAVPAQGLTHQQLQLQQQHQLLQLQQQETRAQLKPQLRHQVVATSYMQQHIPTTTIVTMPPTSQQVTNQLQPRSQYAIAQATPHVLRAPNASSLIQHRLIVQSSPARSSQVTVYHTPRHAAPHSTPPPAPQQSAAAAAVATQGPGAFGTNRMGLQSAGTPNPRGMAGSVQNPNAMTLEGHENVGYGGSSPRDCTDKVLQLPADSSDVKGSQGALSLSGQNLLCEGGEVQTPQVVSSTSGLLINKKPLKLVALPENERCCPCKKTSKCLKCTCSNGGCNDTCMSPKCQFKQQNDQPPGQPKKRKPVAAVAPTVSGAAAVTMQVTTLTEPGHISIHPHMGGNSNIAGSGSPIHTSSSIGSPVSQMRSSNSVSATLKTANELCLTTVVPQTGLVYSAAQRVDVQNEDAPLSRIQAAKLLASMSKKPDTVGAGGDATSGQMLRACLQPQQQLNQGHLQGTVQDIQQQITNRTNLAATNTAAISPQRTGGFMTVAGGNGKVVHVDGKYYLQLAGGGLQPVKVISGGENVRSVLSATTSGANPTLQTNRSTVTTYVATTSGVQLVAAQQQLQHLQQQVKQQQQLSQQPQQLQQQQQQQQQLQPPHSPELQEGQLSPSAPAAQSMAAVSIKPVAADAVGEVESVDLGVSVVNNGQDLIVGMEYKLDYQDGTSQITTWDGQHFRVKGSGLNSVVETPGCVRGGGGGTQRAQQQQLVKGNATGLNMVPAQRNVPVTKIVSRQEMSPQPGASSAQANRRWLHSSVGKEQLSRRPLHPDNVQSESAEGTANAEMVPAAKGGQGAVIGPAAMLKRPRKSTEEGKYAVCANCGQLSSDYDICEGCNKLLPIQPRYFWPERSKIKRIDKSDGTLTQVSNNGPGQLMILDKKKFYGDKADNSTDGTNSVVYIVQGRKQVRPPGKVGTPGKPARGGAQGRGRGRGRKALPEPETVTILSSDDESGALSPTTPQTPVLEDGEITPGSLAGSVSHTPSSSTSRRQKMEDASGQVIAQSNSSKVKRPGMLARGFMNVAIESRSIRLGSLKGTPFDKVILSTYGIHLKMEYENETVELTINADEIVKVIGHFGNNMPVMFVYTSPQCAARIRSICHMTTTSGPYYDPNGKEEPHRRVTIIINSITQQQVYVIKEICRAIQEKSPTPGQILKEIEAEQANIILVKSTPHFGDGPPLMSLVADYEGDDWEEDDEPFDRSRSPSPPRPIFSGPITRLLTYPAPPATGGISVTNEDLFCLNEGEFLNDVIIDFYLKYLFFEILSLEDKARTHIFSSFFYRRLTQRSKRNDEDLNLSLPQRRHGRVRTWTRHVDLFSKDFIIVPINESAHWYLAVICFPELRYPVYKSEDKATTNGIDGNFLKKEAVKKEKPADTSDEKEKEKNADKEPVVKEEKDDKKGDVVDTKEDIKSGEKGAATEAPSPTSTLSTPSATSTPSIDLNIKDRPKISMTWMKINKKLSDTPSSKENVVEAAEDGGKTPNAEEPKGDGDPAASPTVQAGHLGPDLREEIPMDMGSDDEAMDTGEAEEPASSPAQAKEEVKTKETPKKPKDVDMKQPCILIFDSLAGPTRGTVIRTLREYIQVEWDVRKKETCGARVFNRDTFKGANPKCPQQTNFSDCGIFVLQYVEAFFETPILDYHIPMKAQADWFPDERVRRKREELKNLILSLMRKFNPDLTYDPTKDKVT